MKNSIPDVRNSQCIDVFEVASPNSAQASSTGDPGVSTSTRVDAPENQVSCGNKQSPCDDAFFRPVQPGRATAGIAERGIVMVETREAHNLEVAGSNPAPATNFSHSLGFDKPTLIEQMCGVIVDENLALALDEGQNASNAWRLHDHVNNGLKTLVERTEGILTRAKAEPELAEVSR